MYLLDCGHCTMLKNLVEPSLLMDYILIILRTMVYYKFLLILFYEDVY